MDPRAVSTPLDRNQRARLIMQAEGIERRSKVKGQRSGVLGLTGLAVLRVLLLMFHNKQSGICNPSYTAIQGKTGFCRQTVATALHALEAVGLIRIVRRLVRRQINQGGMLINSVVQGSNLYAFKLDGQISIGMLAIPRSRSFPKPSALFPLLFGRVYSTGSNYKKGHR